MVCATGFKSEGTFVTESQKVKGVFLQQCYASADVGKACIQLTHFSALAHAPLASSALFP